MKERRSTGCVPFLVGTAAFLGTVFAWDEFLTKPFRQLGTHGLAWIISDLTFTVRSETYEQPFEGQLFLLVAFVLTILAIALLTRAVKWWLAYLSRADAPVSILETIIHVRVCDDKLHTAEVKRAQKIHANRSGVDAYHYSMSTTFGKVMKDGWEFESKINDEVISSDPLIRYTPTTIEVIERFSRPLPHNWFLTYAPRGLVFALNKYLDVASSLVVVRKSCIKTLDEYAAEEPIFQLTCVRYPAFNVEIVVDLPESAGVDGRLVRGFLITDNVVQNLPVGSDSSIPAEPGRTHFVLRRKSLIRQQTLRIQWKTTAPQS